jgi:F-type H+-transporting ATPase subunit alpha
MKDYQYYLNQTGEIGYVNRIIHSLAYVEGIPGARASEVVMFKSGGLGLILSLFEDYVEVLLLTDLDVKVGDEVSRTGQHLEVPLGDELLGKMINPLGLSINGEKVVNKPKEMRPVDSEPLSILGRVEVKTPLETGVKIVDLVVPLGKGQRELVVGDRKTGKTLFLMQSMLSQAKLGTICIYAAIGKRQGEVKNTIDFVKENKIEDRVVIVTTGSADPAGLIYLTPYTAMTIAEYFRDQGKDTLVIMDDLTAHASYYREISLLARRFPGRSSYPGDIFYIHAKLMERAGNFEKAAITALPVAESALGDLSGYIQTNLMAMTDGHIFFDIDRYNRGIRPAVNPFLSVTRVGLQAQSPLVRDLNRQLSSFLVHLEDLRDFMHFGAEVSESLKKTLNLGSRVEEFLRQPQLSVVPVNIAIFLVAAIWGGYAKDSEQAEWRSIYNNVFQKYTQNAQFRQLVDSVVMGSPSFSELMTAISKQEGALSI